MNNISDLVPRINEMKSHKCLWCDTSVLSIPGELKTLYCQSGFSHTSEEPHMLFTCPEDVEQKVTFFSYNGTKSRKGIVRLLDETSACVVCNDEPPVPYCNGCRAVGK